MKKTMAPRTYGFTTRTLTVKDTTSFRELLVQSKPAA
jgi:hypothetical protein